MGQQIKLSTVIITLNEQDQIERCIKSVQDISDEILVVDSYSTDKTEEICRSLGARFVQNPFAGHIEQKNHALDLAKNQYVLSLDADEALGPELKESIKKVLSEFKADAYSMNRLTNYVGHWVRHCDWYPDVKIRLLKKGKGRWGGTNPHDMIIMQDNCTVEHLTGDILHYSYKSISDHVAQTNKFTTIAAKAAYAKGVRSSNFKIVTRPVLKFFKDYFLRLGFLDGRYGFIICFINSLSALLKYSKIKELQDGRPI